MSPAAVATASSSTDTPSRRSASMCRTRFTSPGRKDPASRRSTPAPARARTSSGEVPDRPARSSSVSVRSSSIGLEGLPAPPDGSHPAPTTMPSPRHRGDPQLYRWWVFVHVAGVFGFLVAHGVSVMVTFRLRRERDPAKVNDLLQLSGSSIRAFYWSLGVLLVGGVVAGFEGHWWGKAWIWVAIALLVLTSLAMYGMARPFYRRVGVVARAVAGG